MKSIKGWVWGVISWFCISTGIWQVTRPPQIEHGEPDNVKTPQVDLIEKEVGSKIYPQAYLQGIEPESRRAQAERAIKKLNDVLASDCFKNELSNRVFTENKNMTGGDIYKMMIEKSPLPARISVFNGTWKQNYIWKTMGIDNGSGIVYLNSYFLTNENMASTILHEIMHQLGFAHHKIKSTSVPYQMNDIYKECSNQ